MNNEHWALKPDDIELCWSIATNRAQVFVNKSDWVSGSKIRRNDKTILVIKYLGAWFRSICFSFSLSLSVKPIEMAKQRNIYCPFDFVFDIRFLFAIFAYRSGKSTTEIEQLAQHTIYLYIYIFHVSSDAYPIQFVFAKPLFMHLILSCG